MKRMIGIVLALVCLTAVVPAGAADTASAVVQSGTVTIEAAGMQPFAQVSILVLRPGKTEADLAGARPADAASYSGQCAAGRDGSVRFTYKMAATSAPGTYLVLLSDGAKQLQAEFVFETNVLDMINEIETAELRLALEQNAAVIGIGTGDGSTYQLLSSAGRDSVAAAVGQSRPYGSLANIAAAFDAGVQVTLKAELETDVADYEAITPQNTADILRAEDLEASIVSRLAHLTAQQDAAALQARVDAHKTVIDQNRDKLDAAAWRDAESKLAAYEAFLPQDEAGIAQAGLLETAAAEAVALVLDDGTRAALLERLAAHRAAVQDQITTLRTAVVMVDSVRAYKGDTAQITIRAARLANVKQILLQTGLDAAAFTLSGAVSTSDSWTVSGSGGNYTITFTQPFSSEAAQPILKLEVDVKGAADYAVYPVELTSLTVKDALGQTLDSTPLGGSVTVERKTTITGGGGGGGGGSTSQPGGVSVEGNTISAAPGAQSGTAVVKLTAAQLAKTQGSELVVKVSPVQAAQRFETEFPAALFTAGDLDRITQIRVETAAGTVDIPKTALGATGSVRVILESVTDKSQLPDQYAYRPALRMSILAGGKTLDQLQGQVTVSVPYTGGGDGVELLRLDGKEAVKLDGASYSGSIASGKTDQTGVFVIGTASAGTAGSKFSDLTGYEWAQESIYALEAQGILAGTGGGNFSPAQQVTGAEYLKMLLLALDQHDSAAQPSAVTVPQGAWYASYVGTAEKLGLLDGTFQPEAPLSRQEMARLTYGAGQKAGITFPQAVKLVNFKDARDIAKESKTAVVALQQAGIVNGMGDGTFAPGATLERAQAAKVIYGLLQLR